MKITEIKVGMIVQISNDLTKTNRMWNVSGSMRKMKGKRYKVEYIRNDNGVDIHAGDRAYWTFCPEDLIAPKITPPQPPVMFDPKNILT